jgi:hypothetical protein
MHRSEGAAFTSESSLLPSWAMTAVTSNGPLPGGSSAEYSRMLGSAISGWQPGWSCSRRYWQQAISFNVVALPQPTVSFPIPSCKIGLLQLKRSRANTSFLHPLDISYLPPKLNRPQHTVASLLLIARAVAMDESQHRFSVLPAIRPPLQGTVFLPWLFATAVPLSSCCKEGGSNPRQPKRRADSICRHNE